MDRLIDCLAEWLGSEVMEHERTNCRHNFTQLGTHFGKEVWLSRKGAIEAKAGQPGLIPGSMGTASYVVTGKGNAVSQAYQPIDQILADAADLVEARHVVRQLVNVKGDRVARMGSAGRCSPSVGVGPDGRIDERGPDCLR